MKILNKNIFSISAAILLLNFCIPIIAFGMLSAPLRPGNHVLWFDRLDLSGAIDDNGLNYAENLYFALSEAVDPDSGEDYLINFTSAPRCISDDLDYFYIPIRTFCGSDDEIEAASIKAYVYARAALDAFGRDYPGVFWLCRKTKIITARLEEPNMSEFRLVLLENEVPENNGQLFSMIQPCYPTAESILDAIAEREACIQKILATVTGSTRLEKIRQINKWLTSNNSYCSEELSTLSPDYVLPHGCLSALKGSSGKEGPMCEGFSRAFKVLCDRLNIPCVLESGLATTDNGVQGEHMWNSVQMENGKWYGVDSTWNLSEEVALDDAGFNLANEEYLLVGNETVIHDIPFGQSHSVSNNPSAGMVVTSFTNGPQISAQQYYSDLSTR